MKWEQVDFQTGAIKIVGTKNNTMRVVPMTDEVRGALSKRPHHIKSALVFFGPWNLKRTAGTLNAFWRGELASVPARAPAQAG